MPTIEDLVKLADEGEIADFQDAVAEILAAKAEDAVAAVASEYVVNQESVEDEDLEDLDVASDEDGEDEELELIANTITEEEFEQLDELSKKTLVTYLHKSVQNKADNMTHYDTLKKAKSASYDARNPEGSKVNASPEFRSKAQEFDTHADKEMSRAWRQRTKREVGIGRASNKLAKD